MSVGRTGAGAGAASATGAGSGAGAGVTTGAGCDGVMPLTIASCLAALPSNLPSR